MNVLVLGATGATGLLVVKSALAAGHSVTAFVRDQNRLQLRHANLAIFEGDAMDPASIAAAVQGTDAVVSALGTMPEGKNDTARRQPGVPVCSVGTRNVLAALASDGACRLIVESSVSVGDSYASGVLGAGFVVKLALGQVMADKEEQEAAIRVSECDWTIVRPVRLTNKPAQGDLKSATDLRWSILSTATRADVANYMVSILTDRSTYKKSITLRN